MNALELAEGEMLRLLMDPSLSVLPETEWPEVIPTAKVQADPAEWHKIAAGLCARRICSPLPSEQLLRHRGKVVGAGAFGVGKRKFLPVAPGEPQREILRLITNLVPSNSLQRGICGDIRSLPYFAKWGLMEMEPGDKIHWTGEDIQCCFFVFGLPQQWKPYFAFAQPVPRGAMIKHLREFKADEVIAALPKAEEIWISMATIPMGWISAVGVCQYLHRRLLHLGRPLGAGLDRKSEFRKDRGAQLGPDFRLSEFYECYIDNYDEAEITRGDAEPKNGGWVQGGLGYSRRTPGYTLHPSGSLDLNAQWTGRRFADAAPSGEEGDRQPWKGCSWYPANVRHSAGPPSQAPRMSLPWIPQTEIRSQKSDTAVSQSWPTLAPSPGAGVNGCIGSLGHCHS